MNNQSLNGHNSLHKVIINSVTANGGSYAGSEGVKEAKRLCKIAYQNDDISVKKVESKTDSQSIINGIEQRIKERREWLDSLSTKEPIVYKFELLPDVQYTWLTCAEILKLPNTVKASTTLRTWVAKGIIKHVQREKPLKITLEEVLYVVKVHKERFEYYGASLTAQEKSRAVSREYYQRNKTNIIKQKKAKGFEDAKSIRE